MVTVTVGRWAASASALDSTGGYILSKKRDRKPGPADAKGPRGASRQAGRDDGARAGGLRGWFRLRNPIFRFVLLLAILMIAAKIVLSTSFVDGTLAPKYLRAWAHVSAATMNLWGENASVYDSSIRSSRFSVNIKEGCDAVQPTVLFIMAVLASPVAFRPKLPGLAIGIFFLMAMNLVRVISLFYIGVYWNSAFETMHHDVWQAVFIILSILAWWFWAVWAVKKTRKRKHAAR